MTSADLRYERELQMALSLSPELLRPDERLALVLRLYARGGPSAVAWLARTHSATVSSVPGGTNCSHPPASPT
jgi:hypothetical protein